MDWGQIEVKWAEMARRVRSDLPDRMPEQDDPPAPARPSGDGPELMATALPERDAAKAVAG